MRTILNRRQFLGTVGLSTAELLVPKSEQSKQDDAKIVPHLPTPLPKQTAWQDFELGLLYHFDLDVYMPGGHHHERSRRERLNPNLYRPVKLDTDQWLEAA